jgi:AcrR family transcriptional regulator
MTDGSDEGSMRRRPTQARGQLRVAQILDAAELLFGEEGYAAVTTNAIAARAGVPIGSIYQFFPHKEAILRGVAERYRAEAAALFDVALEDGAADLPTTELVARLLGVMVEYGRVRIGFSRVVLQAGGDPQLQAAAAAILGDAIRRLEGLLARRAAHLPAERRQLMARVGITAVSALLAVVIAEKPQGEAHTKAIIAEAQRMLTAYLTAEA